MTYLANTAQIREADRIMIEENDFPGLLLMERAGRMAAELLLHHYPGHTCFLVLAGSGNNGGDGLVIARYLHLAGKEVRILFSHDPTRYVGDAALNYAIIRHLPLSQTVFSTETASQWLAEWAPAPVLIDALLGTGIHSAVRPPVAPIIDFFQDHSLPTVAIDLPSGLSADSGALPNVPLRAAHTYTFHLPKVCHYVTPAAISCGQIHTLDIGIWPAVVSRLNIRRQLLDDVFFRAHARERQPDAHKGTMGHVLIVGGSRDMCGAIAMTAFAAMKSGVGLCTVFTPSACRNAVFSLVPEVMCASPAGQHPTLGPESIARFEQVLARKSAVVIGPGMGEAAETLEFLRAVLPLIEVPVLLDADMLNLLSAHPDLWECLPERRVLTPHPGEMSRLFAGNAVDRRLEAAEAFASERQAVLVLKGAGTIVATPEGHSYVNTSGNPGMATGGSGDVLSGIIGSLLAQGYLPAIAAALGVFLHGKAGDLAAVQYGPAGLSATDIARQVGRASLLSQGR